MILKYLSKINPENNLFTRAVLYVIGCGGLIHLTTLFTISIIRRNASYFNPFYTIDVDQIWPAVSNNVALYILGWVTFFSIIYAIYSILKKRS